MMEQLMNDLEKNMGSTPTLKIAVDTGKSLTKYCYGKSSGEAVCGRFPSAIGLNAESFGRLKAFSASIVDGSYFIDTYGQCDITPTDDNEKNGSGRSVGESNHDQDLVRLCTCYAICKAMKYFNMQDANVKLAVGMPISEYMVLTNEDEYISSIIPVGESITCRYGTETYSFKVESCDLCPETISAFTFNGREENENMVLVDIGGNNVQYLCFKDGNFSTDPTKTATNKGGTNLLIRKIISVMKQKQVVTDVNPVDVLHWLLNSETIPVGYREDKSWMKEFGEIVKAQKKEYLAEYVNPVFDPVAGLYKDELKQGYQIGYTGGGSLLLEDEIKQDNKKAVFFDGGEYANVKGFYMEIR